MIGDQIRRAREARGLSQQAAAELAGVQRKQFSKLENNRGVTFETFRRVVTALEMPVVTLGNVEVLPGNVNPTRIIDIAQSTIDALRTLMQILEAARAITADKTTDEALARAAKETRPPITADDPTVRMLHALVDQIAQQKSEPRK
jgi:transcriptional regulator with XRE-family HTH domain